MIQFDVFHTFVENSVKPEVFFLNSTQRSQNRKFIKKYPSLSSLKVLVNSKTFLTPHYKGLDVNFLRL